MTRAKLDLTGFDEAPANKNPEVLREISDHAGFPSRVATATGTAGAKSRTDTNVGSAYQRPARPSANRFVAVNTRLEPEIATMIYELRDADPSKKRAIADVIGEAVALLYNKEFGPSDRE